MEINFHGKKFIFDKNQNKNISNFDWFIGVLQNEVWEQPTFDTFDKLRDSNKIAVDIGAWIGPTSIYLSSLFKEVISIEADNVAFEALNKNLEDNKCSNVRTYNRAFFKSGVSEIMFGVNGHNFDPVLGSSTSQIKHDSNNENDYKIKTMTIFDLISIIDPNEIELIKVDIEGGDEDILEELISVGSEYNWKIWISFHYGWWKNKDVTRFEYLIDKIKKVSRDNTEIEKSSLLLLIEKNVPESFLIEL